MAGTEENDNEGDSNHEEKKSQEGEDDDDLEEGELKDDDDDDDDDDDVNIQQDPTKRSHHGSAGEQYPPNPNTDHSNKRLSPSGQHHYQEFAHVGPDGPNNRQHHHFNSNSNNNHINSYRYPHHEGPPIPMGHHQMPSGGPVGMYPRGGQGSAGPIQKVSARCRFYSKTSNKCTWGDHCRFEHRDDSPTQDYDGRGPPGPMAARGPPNPPMGPYDRPPYPGGYNNSSRHQPYPLPGPPNYPYDGYPTHRHHVSPPPGPPHPMPRQQHSPYPSPSSGSHPIEPTSPGSQVPPSNSDAKKPAVGPSSGLGSVSPGGSASGPVSAIGNSSPPHPSSSSSSAVVYERKHRLAYEMAPWNDRSYRSYPNPRYDRPEPGPYPRGGYYRNHYSREPVYGREPPHADPYSNQHPHHPHAHPHPMPHQHPHPQMHGGHPHQHHPSHHNQHHHPVMGPAYQAYSNYPSAYRSNPMGGHGPHGKYPGPSHRNAPSDARRSRGGRLGHDEDESSWSDSSSEDSILGQSTYAAGKGERLDQAGKPGSKQADEAAGSSTPAPDDAEPDDLVERGLEQSAGERPEEDERQKILNKMKEIEDLMAKKKEAQDTDAS